MQTFYFCKSSKSKQTVKFVQVIEFETNQEAPNAPISISRVLTNGSVRTDREGRPGECLNDSDLFALRIVTFYFWMTMFELI